MFGLKPPALRFNLFGIPIRLSIMFLLFEFVFAYLVARNDAGRLRDWRFITAFVAISFVSILVQTMAHVIMGRRFGMPGAVEFYSMGARHVGEYPRLRGWQRFLVAAAGPITGVGLICLALWLREFSIPRVAAWFPGNWGRQALVNFSITRFYEINVYYTIYKSLPIQPLPGGDMVREIFLWLFPKRGLALSYLSSILVALAIGVGFVYWAHTNNVPILYVLWPLLFCGMSVLENGKHWITTLREDAQRRREREGPPLPPSEPARQAVELRDDPNADPYARRL